MVVEEGQRLTLVGPNGERARLVVPPEQVPVRALSDVVVDLDALRFGRRLRVTDWWVTEGPHGLQAFTGLLVRDGAQVAIFDRATRIWYFLEIRDARSLGDLVGQEVLLEGYQQGPRTIHVVHYRALGIPAR